MASELTRDTAFFGFSPENEPVMRAKQGEKLHLTTHDCFSGQLKTTADTLETLDWSITNPATGPIYIEGAKPGDVLRVDLHEVKAHGPSVMIAVPDTGALGHLITEEETAILEHRGDTVVFKDKVVVKQKPMLGVIGVAPAEGLVPNSTPGPHGGNMDCTIITGGSRLYLTVAVEGALFGCGDMHSAMGDGEVVVCGGETPGEVTLTPEVVDIPGLPTPFLENDEIVAVIASAESTDAAYKLAIDMMHEFLTKIAGIPVNDAAMLMSLVGYLKFCQVVDPLVTVRFEFPKSVLADYGYTLPA
ncbi:MAG: acetamidase/formamidase family protein [Coriobacteriia bacterium]|nr:acetamidase/formamidase family protein [Coriobacteriia bacterium]